MTGRGVDVQFGGHFVFAAGEIKAHRVLRGHHGVLVGLKDENRRRVRGDTRFGADVLGELVVVIRTKKIFPRAFVPKVFDHRDDGIRRRGDIRPGADLIDGVVRHALGLFIE